MAWENDKPTVVALREIASGLVDYDVIAQDEIVDDEPLHPVRGRAERGHLIKCQVEVEPRRSKSAGRSTTLPAIDALADRLSTYLVPDQVNLVRRAYFYAEQAHDGQRRRSGEAYVTHPSR